MDQILLINLNRNISESLSEQPLLHINSLTALNGAKNKTPNSKANLCKYHIPHICSLIDINTQFLP